MLHRHRPLLELCRCGQPAEEQQVRHFEERALLGEVLDAIAAMGEEAFGPVDIGDGAPRARGVGEARIERDHPLVGTKPGHVDSRVAGFGGNETQLDVVSVEAQGGSVTHRQTDPFGARMAAGGRQRDCSSRIRWGSPW